MPRAGASRQNSGQPPRPNEARQQYNGQRAVPRANGNYAQPRNGYRAPNYGGARPPAWGPSYGSRARYARPYHSQVYVRPSYWAPYRPFYFGRPYYSFRPFWSIGFGLWVGYSTPYPYAYLGTYAPRVYGYDYYSTGSYYVQPSLSIYGGVSFDIQPSDADLFIDGEYVGTVGMFGPTAEPLTLTAGEHRIAIQRDGYRPMEWDVTIEPGQVIPYRGVMDR